MAYKLTAITDDLGRQVTLSYDSDGLLSQIADFSGRTWDYNYDPNTNDLVGVTGPATDEYPTGLSTTYLYDSHNITYVYDANDDLVVRNYYDSNDMVYKQTVGGGDYLFDYDDANNTAMITNPEGIKIKQVYNDSGLFVSRTIYTADDNDEPNSFTWQYIYNDNMKKARILMPAGKSV